MQAFFDSVLGFFENVYSAISASFSTLFLSFDILAGALTLPSLFFGFIPDILSASISIVILVGLIKFILGR